MLINPVSWFLLYYCAERNCAAIEQTMCQDLVKFMTIDIGYSIQRILPATLKTIYVKSSHSAISGINPINPDFEITENAKYGGYDLCSFLVYDWWVLSSFICPCF